MNLHELIDRLHKEHTLTKEEFITLIKERNEESTSYLASLAREEAVNIYGNGVFPRGLVEFTNYCKITAITAEFKAAIRMQIVTVCQKRKSFLPVRMVTSLDIEALFFKAVRILIIQMKLWSLSWQRSESATLIVPSHFLLGNAPKKVIKNYMMQVLIVICFDMKLLTQSYTRNSTQKVFL